MWRAWWRAVVFFLLYMVVGFGESKKSEEQLEQRVGSTRRVLDLTPMTSRWKRGLGVPWAHGE